MQRFRPVRSPNTCHWCAGAWSSFPIWGEEMSPEVPSPICSFVPKVGKKQHMEKYVFLAPEAICPILYKRPENYLSTPTIPTNINQHQPTSTNQLSRSLPLVGPLAVCQPFMGPLPHCADASGNEPEAAGHEP